MNKKGQNIFCLTLLLSIWFQVNLSGQGIYDKLSLADFRAHKPFHEEIDINNFDNELLECAVFFLTNEIRVKKKLPELTYHPSLTKTARIHSDEMAQRNFFDHTNKHDNKLREPEDRAKIAGIKNPRIAENIIEGFILEYSSGEKVIATSPGVFLYEKTREQLPARTYLFLAENLLDLWMHSKGHKANILAKDALELGCGVSLYKMDNFNSMPAVKATQIFQWFEPVQSK
jgi:uncharacterized protein YkwD